MNKPEWVTEFIELAEEEKMEKGEKENGMSN
jgi:hypothetical protein